MITTVLLQLEPTDGERARLEDFTSPGAAGRAAPTEVRPARRPRQDHGADGSAVGLPTAAAVRTGAAG
jgi:hypothetical protein